MKLKFTILLILSLSSYAFADVSITQHCSEQPDIVVDYKGNHTIGNVTVCTSTPNDWHDDGKE